LRRKTTRQFHGKDFVDFVSVGFSTDPKRLLPFGLTKDRMLPLKRPAAGNICKTRSNPSGMNAG
jgi:hypothetical protein